MVVHNHFLQEEVELNRRLLEFQKREKELTEKCDQGVVFYRSQHLPVKIYILCIELIHV